jgi:hypothetical protein
MKFHMSQACSRQTAASAAILCSQKFQNVSSSVFHLVLAAAPVTYFSDCTVSTCLGASAIFTCATDVA